MFLFSLLSSDVKWYPILFDSPLNVVRSVAIWLTLALLIGFAVCLCLFKGEKRSKFVKISMIFFIAYACVVGALYLILSFREDGIQSILFIPLLILLLCVAVGAILLATQKNSLVRWSVYITLTAALVATLICIAVYFSDMEDTGANSVGLYVSAAIAVVAIIFGALWLGRKDKRGLDAKTIAYAGICIAMSFALSYLRLMRMPQGGSITPASLLPLMIFAYAFGVKKGVFVGFIYGVLQAFQSSGDILHPAQFLLDYPVAFACIGFAGIFANAKSLQKYPQVQIVSSGVIAGLLRFLMHFLSGVFAFGAYAPKDTSPVWYSFTYQAAYVLPDIAIALVAAVFVFSSKNFVRELRKMNPLPLENS